jgi:glycosyltransferase involved in cell wall biosynthesis
MRVCHVCNGHTADDSRVFHRTCCELAKAGYEVHLIARGKGETAYTERGVVIHPLPEPGGRWQRYTRASHVAQVAADLKPDLFHVHEPDLLGSVIARAGSRPVVYDVHESFLDMLAESTWLPTWIKPLARTAWDRWERRLVRRCAGVVTVTETIAKRYAAIHPNVRIVANYPAWENVGDLGCDVRDGRTCVIAGALNQDRGLSQAIEALAILRQRDLKVQLTLAGPTVSSDYLKSLWDLAESLGVREQVEYHGILSKEGAMLFQKKADIGLVIYQPLLYCINSLPNKLVECMSLGLPVVFSNFPNYREIAEKTGAGIMVDPTQPEQIADAIESLVRDPDGARRMGEAGKAAVRDRFNWQTESTKLLDLYRQLIGAP